MICAPCRKAGDTLDAGHDTFVEQLSVIVAGMLHRECAGCDCQHKTDWFLNRRA